MTITAPSSRLRGMRDLLPADMARFRTIERAFRDELLGWGYDEVRTPTIEALHLFTSAGTLSPQLLDRVYSFLDWDGWTGERVVLRPDSTIPMTRLYSEQYPAGAKLCYVQNIFRFAQGDQPRELWQCGAEVVGDTWPSGDVELIAAASGVLNRLGITGFEVQLSHTGIMRALLAHAGFAPDERADHYDRLLDGDREAMRALEERLPRSLPLHLLFDARGTGAGYLANLRAAFLGDIPEMSTPLDELETVTRALEQAGYTLELDAALARDFEYYTGPVFRFARGGVSLGAGGRYDTLVQDSAGMPVPACGFALYMERIGALLPAMDGEEQIALQIVAEYESDASLGAALAAAQRLRGNGLRAGLAAFASDNPSGRRLIVRGPDAVTPYELRDSDMGPSTPVSDLDELVRMIGGEA